MKKKIAMLLSLTLITFTACTNDSLDKGEKKTFDELTGKMIINDSSISLVDVNIYQAESNYEWYVYATLSLDISTLDESERHWLDKDASETLDSDKTLNSNIYMTCEDNGLDFDRMINYGFSDVGNYRVYFFGDLNTYKNNFDDSEATVSIEIKQDDLYKTQTEDGEEISLNKINNYTYYVDENIQDVNEMPTDILQAFTEKIS